MKKLWTKVVSGNCEQKCLTKVVEKSFEQSCEQNWNMSFEQILWARVVNKIKKIEQKMWGEIVNKSV